MKSCDFCCKRHLHESTSFEPFGVKIGWGLASRAEGGKVRKSCEAPQEWRVAVKGLIIAPDLSQLTGRNFGDLMPVTEIEYFRNSTTELSWVRLDWVYDHAKNLNCDPVF